MAAGDAAAELPIERLDAGRRNIASDLRPRICRERSIELPMAKERFEFNADGGGHTVSLLFRLTLASIVPALSAIKWKPVYPCK